MSMEKKTYGQRATSHPSAVAKRLLEIIESKRSNLAVSVDVTTKSALLRIVEAVAPHVCMIKVRRIEMIPPLMRQTHIDIVEDFDQDLAEQLKTLSERHNFVIFEDRKFADIGACANASL